MIKSSIVEGSRPNLRAAGIKPVIPNRALRKSEVERAPADFSFAGGTVAIP